MKRLTVLMLTMMLAVGVAACGSSKKGDSAKDEVVKEEVTKSETEGKAPVDILNDVLAVYAEDEKFALMGGDYENMVMDAPGAVSVADGEVLDSLLGYPAANAAMIDQAASMMHAMNQNTFTAAVYHAAKTEDTQAIADAVKENIMGRQWMCGFPDDLVVYSLGNDFIVAAFGAEDVVDTFEKHLKEVYTELNVLYDEDLTF